MRCWRLLVLAILVAVGNACTVNERGLPGPSYPSAPVRPMQPGVYPLVAYDGIPVPVDLGWLGLGDVTCHTTLQGGQLDLAPSGTFTNERDTTSCNGSIFIRTIGTYVLTDSNIMFQMRVRASDTTLTTFPGTWDREFIYFSDGQHKYIFAR